MRVIAGSLGGRRLVAPRGEATRPTSDRVREALFSVIGDVRSAVVLDLYAGTGALGIEALSRGASRVVFVESGRPALAALRANLDALDLGRVTRVVAQPVARALGEVARLGPFDLVLADPPYADASLAIELAAKLGAMPGALAERARLILEHAARDTPLVPANLVRHETRRWGDTAVSFHAWTTS